MVISCCDSRVLATSIFGAKAGDIFLHRNIANMVPSFEASAENHSTAAAVEFAVTVLRVSHVIVKGHSKCGGVEACRDICAGSAPDLASGESFLGRYVQLLRPAYERVQSAGVSDPEFLGAMERENVLVSIENLMSFPFVKERVEAGDLTLHGLWTNIGTGDLEYYDMESGKFQPV